MGDAALLDHPWPMRRKLDVAEHHRTGEAGILRQDDRVELIEGELIEMAPVGDSHAGTVNRLNRLLVLAAGTRAMVAVQNPVRLGTTTSHSPTSPCSGLVPTTTSERGRSPRTCSC